MHNSSWLDRRAIQRAIAQIEDWHEATLGNAIPHSLTWALAHEQVAQAIRILCAANGKPNTDLTETVNGADCTHH